MQIPALGEKLNDEQIKFLQAFSKSCRHSIIAMLKNSQSGHPGGSLSTIDYFTLLYPFILSQTGEKIVVSNGHISPAVYSALAELKYIPKEDVIETFRKIGSIYEGHVTRHVPGIWYGTGPLGIGVSVASAFALDQKMRDSEQKVFAVMGDGEAQEGQVHEMMNFAAKNKLNNLILFVDYNQVQLTDALDKIMPINIAGIFKAAGWEVIEVDGHNYQDMWEVLAHAHQVKDKPVMLLGKTIMGKGVDFMEKEGLEHKATWHGKAPDPEMCDEALKQLIVSDEERQIIDAFGSQIKWHPEEAYFPELLSEMDIDQGEAKLYKKDELTDCRSAYGNALAELAEKNPKVMALIADLRGSCKTEKMGQAFPKRHVECGIAEQHMVSTAGAFSLCDRIPFASTFGAFMSSRAKDQARVNDINHANVKMVSTHCGLSVGEDGPTHQAIDDAGSFLGMFETMVIEPADPNQTDRIIRYVASHYGNFYVRMGRHKFPVITDEDGNEFYGVDYKYEYGKSDLIRVGTELTIVASGPMVHEALKARSDFADADKVEIVAVTSIKQFDQTVFNSIEKTGKVLTLEDHNPHSGLATRLAAALTTHGIKVDSFDSLAVQKYQLSGKSEQLYEKAGISANSVLKYLEEKLK